MKRHLLLFAALSILFAVGCGGSAAAPAATPAQTWPHVGEVGVLQSPAGATLVAASEAEYDALTHAVAAKDKEGFALVIARGGAWEVPNGTHARVLEAKGFLSGRLNVRVLEGKYASESVWIDPSWIVREGAAG